jgi:exodeoxyribonuclease VII large subunit
MSIMFKLPHADPDKVYRVTELTRLIRMVLEDDIGEIWLEGELSNVRRPSSGHLYFTIKDADAQIAAVMFRGNQRDLRFTPQDGLLVKVRGLLSVYEKSGQYQLVIRQMLPGGRGALHAAFEALKARLEREGLFDPARKRPLPRLPQHIGIVTSPTGAAIRDILNVLNRRYSNLHIVLAPVRVQGDGAAAEIATAIADLNDLGALDVLIVGRGGGSLEDLWSFNEECVARAIAQSDVPVISAVGHETDFTISDFVADLRAPTPSAAAEMVVGVKMEFEELLERFRRQTVRAMQDRLRDVRRRCTAAAGAYFFRAPGELARRRREQIDRLRLRARNSLRNVWRMQQQALDEYSLRLRQSCRGNCQARAARLERLSAQLRIINPLAVLDRGYSITMRPDGCVIKSGADLRVGDRLITRFARDAVESEVLQNVNIEKNDPDAGL